MELNFCDAYPFITQIITYQLKTNDNQLVARGYSLQTIKDSLPKHKSAPQFPIPHWLG